MELEELEEQEEQEEQDKQEEPPVQAMVRVVSGRERDESSLDQELAEFNLVINVRERGSGGRMKHAIPKERRDRILKRWAMEGWEGSGGGG